MGENSENHSVSQFSPPPSRELRSALRQPWLTLPAPLSAELSHWSYSRLLSKSDLRFMAPIEG